MQYISTRGGEPVALEDAIMSGTAPDGGLYVPVELPHFDPAAIAPGLPIAKFAAQVLKPFFTGSSLASELEDIFEKGSEPPQKKNVDGVLLKRVGLSQMTQD